MAKAKKTPARKGAAKKTVAKKATTSKKTTAKKVAKVEKPAAPVQQKAAAPASNGSEPRR